MYFAGTLTATMWLGYMEGAITSGERAALEVIFHTDAHAQALINLFTLSFVHLAIYSSHQSFAPIPTCAKFILTYYGF